MIMKLIIHNNHANTLFLTRVVIAVMLATIVTRDSKTIVLRLGGQHADVPAGHGACY